MLNLNSIGGNEMKQVDIELHIVPSDVDTIYIEGCDPTKIGKKYSSSNQVMVNKTGPDSYTILYKSDVFEELTMPVLGKNIINILMKNLKESEINIGIIYHYEYMATNLDEDDVFSTETALNIIQLHIYMDKMFRERTAVVNGNVIKYTTSDSVIETAEYLKDLSEEESNDSDDEYDEDEEYQGDDTDDEDDEEVDVATELSEILKSDYKDKKNKGKKKKEYGSSRVFRAAKSPKRAYKRHGVLICSKKSALKKDEKILKEFLKDFFPGNAEWKKEFRKEVLKRWMSMYVVTSNKLKQLEKEYKKKKKKKSHRPIDTNKALDLTRRLLNVPLDTWSDPSK